MRRHYRAAYAVALGMVGQVDDAEDICQEGFLRALQHLEDCREPDKFAHWLMRIVRNLARDHRRRSRSRATEPLDERTASGGTRASRQAEQGDLRRKLVQALGQLSEVQRQVVLLHDLEEWTHRAIGESLGISEVMSRQHLFVARQRLRQWLGSEILKEVRHD